MKNNDDMWILRLGLYQNEKHILEHDQWLNDGIIHAAQSLLSNQTKGKIYGWQTTQLAREESKFKFRQVPSRMPFIQILHISASHWAVASNIDVSSLGGRGSCNDTVALYDSARPIHVNQTTKQMICTFFKTSADAIHFDIVNVETQHNSHDCGVYAIANATELALGGDPALCRWDHSVMRTHLKACLEKGEMKCFPTLGKRRIPIGSRIRSTSLEKVYCIASCRMPNNKQRPMIACDNCNIWYHKDCVKLEVDVSYSGIKWFCSRCNNFLNKLAQ